MTLIRDKGKGGQVPGIASGEMVVSYEADTYSWALQQAHLLRAGQWDRIDVQNVADEIADVARRELRALRSAIRLILQHLLKWDAQAEKRSRSRALTVRTQRRTMDRLLSENPGLRAHLTKLVAEAYVDARDLALDETDLPEDLIPVNCGYDWDEIMNRQIAWPVSP